MVKRPVASGKPLLYPSASLGRTLLGTAVPPIPQAPESANCVDDVGHFCHLMRNLSTIVPDCETGLGPTSSCLFGVGLLEFALPRCWHVAARVGQPGYPRELDLRPPDWQDLCSR